MFDLIFEGIGQRREEVRSGTGYLSGMIVNPTRQSGQFVGNTK
jgi:hypothetical protein